MTGTLAFAFAAGMLSTVNPCGFAMLPAFLAFYLGLDQASTAAPGRARRPGRQAVNGLVTGALISLGFAGVFTITGLLVALGLRSIIGAVPWVAVIIGTLLTAAGIAMVTGRHVGIIVGTHRVTRAGRGPGAMLAFGAAYAAASLSCTLAVLLAVIAQALATNSITTLVSVFVAYAAGASTVLTLLALSAALASSALATGLRRISRYLPRVAGAVLVASGIYLIAYWVPALGSGNANQTLVRGASPLTSAVSDFVQAHTIQIGAAAIAAVSVALLAALWMRRQPASEPTTDPDSHKPPHQNRASKTAPDLDTTRHETPLPQATDPPVKKEERSRSTSG